MALRSGYKGFNKLLPGLKILRPGTLGIDNDVLISELNKTFFPRSEQAVLGAKNLIPYPYADGMSKETNGITFTVQTDGSVIADGTATAGALFELWKIDTFKLPIGKAVTLNGGIDNKAMIQYWAAFDFDYKTQGSDVSFTPTTDALASGRLTIFVDAGKTLNNVVFKPMIRLATDTDPTYAPYAMTNRELTDAVTPIRDVSGITLAENVVANDASEFNVFKIGQLVVLSFVIKGIVANAGTWFEVASLNEGYKVAYNFVGNAAKNNNKDAFDCLLQQDNKIRIRNIENAIVATDIIKITAVYISK